MLTIVTIYLEHSFDLVKSTTYGFILITIVLNKYLSITQEYIFIFLKKLLLFSKDTLNWSKVMIKTFTWSQNSILSKCFYFVSWFP